MILMKKQCAKIHIIIYEFVRHADKKTLLLYNIKVIIK